MQQIIAKLAVCAGIIGLALISSCGKEAALNPPILPDAYQLPQGNQPYDDTIVAFKQQYGSYLLYRFSHRDFAYGAGGMLPDTASEGNSAYIGEAISFFKQRCLAFYSESFIKKTLPLKIILAEAIGTRSANGGVQPSAAGFAASPTMLGIGWANERLGALTAAERKKIIGKMHRYYVLRAILSGRLNIPADFLALYPAPNTFVVIRESNKYDYGLLEYVTSTIVANDINNDFVSYVDAITSQTTAELQAGILSTKVDKKGVVKKKYNVMLKFFQEQHGFDLSAAGNQP